MINDFSVISENLCDLLRSRNGCEYIDLNPAENFKFSTNGHLNVLHLNIRSLVKNIDLLILLLNDLHDKGVVVHLIGICETFLTESSKVFVNIKNYINMHYVRGSCLGGGVSIYTHDSIKLKRVIKTPITECIESCAVKVDFQYNRVFMCEFYRIPNMSDAGFSVALDEILHYTNTYKTCFLCTDQNYDLLKSHVHNPTRAFIEEIYDNKFIPTILKPTRITHASSTLINNIYAKS